MTVEYNVGRQYLPVFNVKPEYLDKWGDGVDESTTLGLEEVSRLATEWQLTFDDLRSQLDPVKRSDIYYCVGEPDSLTDGSDDFIDALSDAIFEGKDTLQVFDDGYCVSRVVGWIKVRF